MKFVRKTAAMLLAFALICAMSVRAFATELPDLTKTGSISVTMTYQGKAVPGGRLKLYQVGEIAVNDGDYGFALTEDFAGSRLPLEDISSAELAGKLADYAEAQKLTGTSRTIGSDGTATFFNRKPGLYLIIQTRAAEGYEAASPFLVSVPMEENGAYVYNVDATPKMELLKEKPEESVPPSTPTDSNLPQTGQLNWPVPVLTVLGLCLFLLGFYLRYGAKKERHET